MFEDVERELGRLDVLVNNAGIGGPTAPTHELSFEDWSTVVNVNLNGTFLVTRRAIPLLKQSEAASIVKREALANQSIQDFIDPNDIAALVLFLSGPHGRTISGQMLPIDGDSKSTQ